MATQQQDLVFFDDNTLLPREILAQKNSALHIITHAEETQPTWLINSLVETCLVGTANSVNRDTPKVSTPRASVTYVSFLHSQESLFKSSRKQGLDLESMGDFHFVDCFSGLFSTRIPNPGAAKDDVAKLFTEIASKVASQSHANKVVIVQAPELLLAATDLSSNDLVHCLQKVSQKCNLLVTIAHTNEALIDFDASLPTDPVFRITDFLVKLHHKSSLNVNISPLATGKAKDITGSITVSKGTVPNVSKVQVVEKNYVYHISKEANVKVFFR